MTKIPPYVSYSAFHQFVSDCAKQYQLIRLLGVPELPAMWFAGGRAVHSVTEKYDRDREKRRTVLDLTKVRDDTRVTSQP